MCGFGDRNDHVRGGPRRLRRLRATDGFRGLLCAHTGGGGRYAPLGHHRRGSRVGRGWRRRARVRRCATAQAAVGEASWSEDYFGDPCRTLYFNLNIYVAVRAGGGYSRANVNLYCDLSFDGTPTMLYLTLVSGENSGELELNCHSAGGGASGCDFTTPVVGARVDGA